MPALWQKRSGELKPWTQQTVSHTRYHQHPDAVTEEAAAESECWFWRLKWVVTRCSFNTGSLIHLRQQDGHCPSKTSQLQFIYNITDLPGAASPLCPQTIHQIRKDDGRTGNGHQVEPGASGVAMNLRHMTSSSVEICKEEDKSRHRRRCVMFDIA